MSGSKKSFTRSPAMAFISNMDNAQEDVQDVVQEVSPKKFGGTHKNTPKNVKNAPPSNLKQARKATQEDVQEDVQDAVHNVVRETTPRRNFIRTQGRKGQKKPRINMAFENYDAIRHRAEVEGKSITQFVNDVLADFLER